MQEDQPIGTDPSQLVVPLHAEQLDAARLKRETGRVKISTVTKLREQPVDEMLAEEHAHIERVAVGAIVDAMPDIRQEGEVTIIPVVEEVLVVEKRLFLKQEIRVTRVRTSARHQETVVLRQQEAVVQRTQSDTDGNVIGATTQLER